ncbi:hypothetical protein [Pelagerythrobacter marensis]|uniref:hypothetical protein n=1 Tax=Pelagerythrobacter marensis TaxID=543877 RepID=UPI0009E40030|nr:hypothetical protein [Pelagerythrobacter marensis]
MHRFRIHTLADPEALARVVGAFARRGIVPLALRARREGDECRIDADIAGLSPQQAATIAAGLGETFTVLSVRLQIEGTKPPSTERPTMQSLMMKEDAWQG